MLDVWCAVETDRDKVAFSRLLLLFDWFLGWFGWRNLRGGASWLCSLPCRFLGLLLSTRMCRLRFLAQLSSGLLLKGMCNLLGHFVKMRRDFLGFEFVLQVGSEAFLIQVGFLRKQFAVGCYVLSS